MKEKFFEFKYEVLLVACVIGVLVVMLYAAIPLWESSIETFQEYLDNRSKITEADEGDGLINDLKKQNKELEDRISNFRFSVPKDQRLSEIIKIIDRNKEKSGVKILNINASPIISKRDYDEIPLNFDIVGKYHDISAFINGLESLENVVGVRDIIIKSRYIHKNILNTKLRLSFYMMD